MTRGWSFGRLEGMKALILSGMRLFSLFVRGCALVGACAILAPLLQVPDGSGISGFLAPFVMIPPFCLGMFLLMCGPICVTDAMTEWVERRI